jgi:hypothetical protein
MDNDNDTLEIRSLKRIFMGLRDEQQLILVQDLMEMAGLDSICRINSIVTVAGVDMTAPDHETPEAKDLRLYKDSFETFIMPFVSSFLRVIRRSYLDDCFKIYQLLAERSVGGRYSSQCGTGDKVLYAITQSPNENFKSIEEQDVCFKRGILMSGGGGDAVELELLELSAEFPNDSRIDIHFVDLLVILHNNPEKAYMVLLLLGYLKDHPLEKEAEAAFRKLYPAVQDLTDLASIFTGTNGECPHFPGLGYWHN